MDTNFSIRKTSRGIPPRILYKQIKTDVLGKDFDLSLVFVGDMLSTRLNVERRGKGYTPNVLTFPLTESSGEMFINLREAKREAKKYSISYTTWTLQLFIHGLLHLEGMSHGDTMEKKEQKLVKKYS
ncbi:rRNA maturation RNase YbeY [Candidatus Wolfebacteria bacterium]|nr:rRNA maturation RNase YbeY [Candidatus Wolfebacteria bacterium]